MLPRNYTLHCDDRGGGRDTGTKDAGQTNKRWRPLPMKSIKHPFSMRITAESDIGYDYRRKVGNHIRALREAAGMTQRELGRAVDIHDNSVSAIELGRNPIPPERYRAFARALRVDPVEFGQFLLEWTDPWLWELLHGEAAARKHHLKDIPDRVAGRE